MTAHEPMVRFLSVLRKAGVRISVSEGLDAMRAAEVVGYSDRILLRDALGLTVAKSVEEKETFENCFEEFFCREEFKGKDSDCVNLNVLNNPDESSTELGQMLLDGDGASIMQAVERAANEVNISSIRMFTQVNLFARRIMDVMGLDQLDGEIGAMRNIGSPQMSMKADRLEEARDNLREEVADFVRRQLKIYAKGEYDRIRDMYLRQMKMGTLDASDMARMRIIIRQIARRLATRHSRVLRKRRKGKLDVRRIIRKNIPNDGVLFRTAFRFKKIDRPKIVAICDVSRSVATSAEFLLLFLWSLREVLSGVRAFAFSNDMIEVTEILDKMDADEATKEILRRIGFGGTNYGQSFTTFRNSWFGALDRKTTVIILGDARGNRTPPRADIVREISERAKRLIWLNPEGRPSWGTGDSDMLRYKNYCHLAKVCHTVTDLETVVSDLLEAERFN